jgi:hypothetical protein
MYIASDLTNDTCTGPEFGLELVFRFFEEATSTKGGKLVCESLFVLFGCVVLSVLLELSRSNTASQLGKRSSSLVFALFPVACQVVGVSVVFPLVAVWMSRTRRHTEWAERENKVEVFFIYLFMHAYMLDKYYFPVEFCLLKSEGRLSRRADIVIAFSPTLNQHTSIPRFWHLVLCRTNYLSSTSRVV